MKRQNKSLVRNFNVPYYRIEKIWITADNNQQRKSIIALYLNDKNEERGTK